MRKPVALLVINLFVSIPPSHGSEITLDEEWPALQKTPSGQTFQFSQAFITFTLLEQQQKIKRITTKSFFLGESPQNPKAPLTESQ
jgi:hypothetical protein